MSVITCRPRSLTDLQSQRALRRSLEVNLANATAAPVLADARRTGRRLALVIETRWPLEGMTLTVQFLDTSSRGLRRRILEEMNAWSECCNMRFVEVARDGLVRIARLNSPEDMRGYWSYVGTEILGIEPDQPTLNLEGFTLKTDPAEFRRVVRHEAGHTLGFDHEHLRREFIRKIDRKKAIAYYRDTQGWKPDETIAQVLTPLSERSILGTREADPVSIMCYEIPAEITRDGIAIVGGADLSPQDRAFAASVYPRPVDAAVPPPVPAALALTSPAAPPVAAAAPQPALPVTAAAVSPAFPAFSPDVDTLHLVILNEFDSATGESSDVEHAQFARVFASYGGARVSCPMRLYAKPGEPKTAFGRIIATHEQIKNFTNQNRGALPSEEDLIRFGTDLFETLFQGDVRRLYDEARARQQNRKLDIVLTSMISWVAEKPWEFAYDPGRESFLATEDVHFVRNVLTAVPANVIPPVSGPLRILVVAAEPVGLGDLSVEQEIEVIRRGFDPLIEAGMVTVEVLARATPRRVQSWLSTGAFNVVHFIGHGQYDANSEQGTLLFENEHNTEFALGVRAAREIFCRRGISLIFLNSCESGSGSRKKLNRGIAQGLVSHGVPAVVANQYSVLDTSATSFAQHFYWALGTGMSIGQAACEARIAVNCSMQGDIIDWAVPVVYVRDPAITLCQKPASIATSQVCVSGSSRRAVQGHQVRVAVWDIDNSLPELGETLEAMNQAQQVFGFELVSLSVPLDCWDWSEDTEEGTPYLRADQLAGRLSPLTVELRVHLLACITRHWMRDADWLNLYGWWSPNQEQPVAVVSTAGFSDLTPGGSRTHRAIVNVAVSTLAGYFGRQDSHADGASDCPLSFNEDRNFDVMTGRQAFDSKCRAKLQNALPRGYLAALEALLKIDF